MKLSATLLLLFFSITSYNQNYTSYFTGSNTDIVTTPQGGICLMGGATEDDRAMTWFLQRANGGDVLVIRASGSNGYNNYLYSELGVNVNSVETIVFNNAAASEDAYVLDKIAKAEAIWLAGGDQWNYVSYWRNTAVDSIINDGITNRNIVIGGTSAGMAVMGKYYFSAQNGTVTSAEALANPYNYYNTVDSTDFFHNAILHDVITDTHFDDPNRIGRMITFLARIYTDYGVIGKGIACDEYTAVCIGADGMARVYGEYPGSDDNAYFIQPNCELADMSPEVCTNGTPLTWNRGEQALKVYRIKGTYNGVSNSFNLNNWSQGTGGEWLNWSADVGVLSQIQTDAIDCSSVGINESSIHESTTTIYPNPSSFYLNINSSHIIEHISFFTMDGRLIMSKNNVNGHYVEIDIEQLPHSIYTLVIETNNGTEVRKFIRS